MKLDLANLISGAFIGRLTDEQAQRDALRFLPGVPEGVGYEGILGTLSLPSREGKRGAREFVFSDGTGAIERIRMDMSAHPELLEALSTTADPHKARNRVARLRQGSRSLLMFRADLTRDASRRHREECVMALCRNVIRLCSIVRPLVVCILCFVVPTVAGSIDLVIHIALERDGVRRVREIVAVPGRVEGDAIEIADIFVDCISSEVDA